MSALRIVGAQTPQQYAERRGLSVASVYRLIHGGPLRAFYVGRRLFIPARAR